MLKVFSAFEKYGRRAGLPNAQWLKAFVLVLRYSGMRIGDAVRFGMGRITENKLFLYTPKTGVPVHSILPDFVLWELDVAPKSSEGHFSWTGKSKLHSAIGKWQRRLQALFKVAEVEGGHAHRFRDTFAVELLLAGVPLERVSVLLGHQSAGKKNYLWFAPHSTLSVCRQLKFRGLRPSVTGVLGSASS